MAGRRIATVGFLVTLVGGLWAWAAVSEHHEASGRQNAVEGRMADVRATIDAQLDESVGQVSVTAGWPDSSTDLVALLDDLLRYADADATEFRDEILERRDEVLADTDDGVLDERLVAGLSDALRDLEDQVVRPLSRAADDAYDDVYMRSVIVTGVSLVLWSAVLGVLSQRWGDRTGSTGGPSR